MIQKLNEEKINYKKQMENYKDNNKKTFVFLKNLNIFDKLKNKSSPKDGKKQKTSSIRINKSGNMQNSDRCCPLSARESNFKYQIKKRIKRRTKRRSKKRIIKKTAKRKTKKKIEKKK